MFLYIMEVFKFVYLFKGAYSNPKSHPPIFKTVIWRFWYHWEIGSVSCTNPRRNKWKKNLEIYKTWFPPFCKTIITLTLFSLTFGDVGLLIGLESEHIWKFRKIHFPKISEQVKFDYR